MKTIIGYTKIFLLLYIAIFNSCSEKNEKIWQIESPDQKIRLSVQKDPQDKMLYYSVQFIENDTSKTFMDRSKLGLKAEKEDFFTDLHFVSSQQINDQNTFYNMISGSYDTYKNTYNEIKLNFKNDKDRNMEIEFRVFNNGVAFRYGFPDKKLKKIHIIKEYSSFKFGEGFMWANPYDTITQWSPGYETYIKSKIRTGTSAPKNKNGWAFPILIESQNHWALISESNLDGSYGGSHLETECDRGEYKIRFAEAKEARGFYERTSILKTPGKTPWRFITIGNDLSDIVESHLVTDLAEPNTLKNTDWIKPGRATWSWWSESDSPKDYNSLLPYIDVASELGWEYSLIDANWNRMKNGALKKLVKYANEKNIGLLIWYNSGGKHNVITEEPRDLMYNRDIRLKEFERISKLGIKGIKVDFFQSDKQEIIRQYIGILEDAAKYHLVVNFHGCTLPRGWRRTYPNLLTMEAFRGAENYKYDEKYPEAAPSMITTIPFVRGVVGSTDYTPLTLSNSKYPHLTTNGFELALPVIIESGLLHCSENQKVLRNQSNSVKSYLKEIPATWDEIKYLSGYPGKDVVLARRKGSKWFIAGINGEKKSKVFKLDLAKFQLKRKEITLITDALIGKAVKMEKTDIIDGKITINILPFGGFIAIVQ